MNSRLKKLSDLYWKYERHLSSLGLVSGFLFDIFTLTRVDEFLENLWVGFHLVVAAVGILFLNLYDSGKLKAKVPGRAHFWWTFVIQFAFGGLFSVYLVFYSRSASFFASWPFLLLLVINFIANERLREHYVRTSFQMATLFLGIFFYDIYIVPIIFSEISSRIFILSGVISLIIMAFFIFVLTILTPGRIKKEKWILLGSIAGSYLLINGLYFAHLIPPIPLSLKQAHVYHSVVKNNGLVSNYTVLEEEDQNQNYFQTIINYFLNHETIHLASGESAYVYTAIFSPANFSTNIVHRWQYYDEVQKKWITSAVIPLYVSGGREAGFRTFSAKPVSSGRWRVRVETSGAQVIGTLSFTVVTVDFTPLLYSVTK